MNAINFLEQELPHIYNSKNIERLDVVQAMQEYEKFMASLSTGKHKSKLTNDQLGELLPAHQTMKLQKGWMAEVHYNHSTVKIGSRTKPKYKIFSVYECKTEREARQKIYAHLKKKKVI